MTMTGAETIARVREHQSETLLAFSTGKDAIAAWLAIRDSFEAVHPYYLYLVPGLEFVEESLAYYEQYFGEKIVRLPHPALHIMLNRMMYQPPERCIVIEQANLPNHKYTDIQRAMVKIKNLQSDCLVANGVRAADSPMRRVAIKTHGAISHNLKKYYPVWDWRKADLIQCFKRHNVKLPDDYKMFGRTFDGIDLRFLLPLKKHRPADYQRVLDWFPLVDLEVFRWEKSNGR